MAQIFLEAKFPTVVSINVNNHVLEYVAKEFHRRLLRYLVQGKTIK